MKEDLTTYIIRHVRLTLDEEKRTQDHVEAHINNLSNLDILNWIEMYLEERGQE